MDELLEHGWNASYGSGLACWPRVVRRPGLEDEIGDEELAAQCGGEARCKAMRLATGYLVADLSVGYLVKNPFMCYLFGWVLAAGGI